MCIIFKITAHAGAYTGEHKNCFFFSQKRIHASAMNMNILRSKTMIIWPKNVFRLFYVNDMLVNVMVFIR